MQVIICVVLLHIVIVGVRYKAIVFVWYLPEELQHRVTIHWHGKGWAGPVKTQSQSKFLFMFVIVFYFVFVFVF